MNGRITIAGIMCYTLLPHFVTGFFFSIFGSQEPEVEADL